MHEINTSTIICTYFVFASLLWLKHDWIYIMSNLLLLLSCSLMANLECTPNHNDYNLVNARTRYLIFVSMLNYIMFLNTQCTFLVFSSGRLPVRVPWSTHQVDSACWYLVEPWGVLFWVCLVLWSIKLTINEVIIDQLVCSFESFVIFTRDLFFWYSASLLSFFFLLKSESVCLSFISEIMLSK